MNNAIFKEYDIRGLYYQDFDDAFAYSLGLAYSKLRKAELPGKEKIKIVVGEDMRISSAALKRQLIEGLLDGGLDVVDIGLSSTPTFYFAVAHYGYDGGILVSASHNLPEYNGFKVVRDRAIPVSKDSGLLEIRNFIVSNSLEKLENRGSIEVKQGILKEQVDRDLGYTDVGKIRKLKIVLDPANSMGALYMEELFSRLNCEIIKLDWKLSENPVHGANPYKKENIADLCAKVIEDGASLGIATDGDGDRIFFVDERGQPVEPHVARAIFCKIFLKNYPGAKIAYDIRPGKIAEDVIKENGGIPVVTRVGHSLIKEQMIREGIIFGAESSGHFFLSMDDGCYEVPMIVTLKLLQDLSESRLSLSEYAEPFKKYFNSGEINFELNDKEEVINKIKIAYGDGTINELDGLSVEYPDWWFNVRLSHTEPFLRLIVEARTQELMEQKVVELTGLISS